MARFFVWRKFSSFAPDEVRGRLKLQAVLRMLSLHEFRVTGFNRRGRLGWTLAAGLEVPPAAKAFAQSLLEQRRYSGFPGRSEEDGQEPFLQALKARGYDLSTLGFSMFLKGRGKPQKPRVLRMRPGTLHARWGWVEYDRSPDICSCWSTPARKADSNLFLALLSSRAHFSRPAGLEAVRQGKFQPAMGQLEELGWDLRTLKFSVKHSGLLYRPDFAGKL
jgi:hypothetical protein